MDGQNYDSQDRASIARAVKMGNKAKTNMRCMLYINAGAATMASAWFIHWQVRPVRGLYGPVNFFLTFVDVICCKFVIIENDRF